MEGQPSHSNPIHGPNPPPPPSENSALLELIQIQSETLRTQGELLVQLQQAVVKLSANGDNTDGSGASGKRSGPEDSNKPKKFKVIEDLDDDEEESSPFSAGILVEEFPPRVKWPTFDHYDGASDPKEHLVSFIDAISPHRPSGAIKCRLFITTLKGSARRWFTNLPEGSIFSFAQLKQEFLTNFSSITKQTKKAITLLLIQQEAEESLREYITRFSSASREVSELTPEFYKQALTSGLKEGGLRTSISKMPLISMSSLLAKVQKYLDSEDELMTANSVSSRQATASHLNPHFSQEQVYTHHRRQSEPRTYNRFPTNLPPMVASLTQIVAAIRKEPYFVRPPKMVDPHQFRDRSKYCHYHEQHGHTTDNCLKLKTLLKRLIDQGLLKDFLYKQRDGRNEIASVSMDRGFDVVIN